MAEVVEPTLQLLQLLQGVYKILTRDTIRPSDHLPCVTTHVHRLYIAKSVDDAELLSAPSVRPLINMINTVEIRQPFEIVDAPFRRKGEIALVRNCKFVGIENIYGERLSKNEYQVKITGSPDCPSKTRIDTGQLLNKQGWMAGQPVVYVVSSTDDQDIFGYYLAIEQLRNGDFMVKPGKNFAAKRTCSYRGGSLYAPCFLETRYGGYYNLDEGNRRFLHRLACAIDIIEVETFQICRTDDLAGQSLPPLSRCGRVYCLGLITQASERGVVLAESDDPRVVLPKWDLKRPWVDSVKLYGQMPTEPVE